MTKKISIASLIGKPEPILELAFGEQTYLVLRPNDLPEIHYLRLLQANLEFSEANVAVARESTIIHEELSRLKDDEPMMRSLINRLTLLQSSLISPARHAIEAMAQMPEDLLANLPSLTIEKLYSEINAAANPTVEGESTEEGKQEV